MKVPAEVLTGFREHSEASSPELSVRALTDWDGNLGETYVLTGAGVLILASRKLGDAYAFATCELVEVTGFATEDARPFVFLSMTTPERAYRLKLATHDKAVLGQLEAAWAAVGGVANAERNTASSEEEDEGAFELDAYYGFCAALHAVVYADGKVDDLELASLKLILSDGAALAAGLAIWEQLGTDVLIEQLKVLLNDDQKLCLIANALQLAMVDGALASAEKAVVKRFRDELGVNPDDVRTIYDVVLLKNDLSIFSE